MKLIFAQSAWEDYLYWQKTDKKLVGRINVLIKKIQRDPFAGVGKPEPLNHNPRSYWSRRINSEHRIIYKMTDDALLIAQLRYHY
ncbi:Txe/YoeB family addiction module toxin [Halopseudomonas pachastrellae]|nr:Txe/YoeB family addiction module toxin [Halopseudomonas pachastrellae]